MNLWRKTLPFFSDFFLLIGIFLIGSFIAATLGSFLIFGFSGVDFITILSKPEEYPQYRDKVLLYQGLTSLLSMGVFPLLFINRFQLSPPLFTPTIEQNDFFKILGLCLLSFVISFPVIESMVSWNQELSLPTALSSIEESMVDSEKQLEGLVNYLAGGTTFYERVLAFIVMAGVAGFAEEVLFRGILQRLFMKHKFGFHFSIWLSAFIFSAIHFQFLGFFPRLVLGAFFGYAFAYSETLWLPIFLHLLNNATSFIILQAGYSMETEFFNFPFYINLGITALVVYIFYRIHRIHKNYEPMLSAPAKNE